MPGLGEQVTGPAHAFRTAGERDVGIAEHDLLGGGDDRLQAGAAKAVERQGRNGFRHAGADRGDAGNIHILGSGMNDMTEHRLADLGRRNAGTRDRLAGNAGSEIAGRDPRQGTTEVADGGANARGDDNCSAHGPVLLPMPAGGLKT
ncbi:hypothetical protein D3C72_1954000 [compost metagenome]